jgi:predicted  nucleic acid-binding Zn-ribbon protein
MHACEDCGNWYDTRDSGTPAHCQNCAPDHVGEPTLDPANSEELLRPNTAKGSLNV